MQITDYRDVSLHPMYTHRKAHQHMLVGLPPGTTLCFMKNSASTFMIITPENLDGFNNFWATVCKTALSVCPVLSVLSVTLVYCGQTVGLFNMKLGTPLGLGTGNIVLDGNPAPTPPKGDRAPNFDRYLLWLNDWMDQDATW